MRGDKDAEFEDGLQLCGKPLGLKVLEFSLGLPNDRHIQAQAEHAGETGCSASTGSQVGNAGVSREVAQEMSCLSCHWLLKSCPFT